MTTPASAPPSWAEIHERVPECRPKVIGPPPSGGHVSPNWLYTWDSLCCMAAIEWLAKRGDKLEVVRDGSGYTVIVEVAEYNSAYAIGDTLDAAIRAAVDTVSKEKAT